MTFVEQLHALYDHWRTLTEEEGAAIEHADWSRLTHAQTAKSRLQPRITDVSRKLEPSVHEQEFRPVIQRLIELERRNQARLQDWRQDAEAEQQELNRSSRHLRQLHQTYVPPARPHWQSYS